MPSPLPHNKLNRVRSVVPNPSHHGTLVERSHEILLQDTPKIPEMTLESLLLAVTPTVPKGFEYRVLTGLVNSGTASESRPGWTCMAVDPASSNDVEGKAFTPLLEMFNQILSTADITEPRINFKPNGSKTLDS